MRYIYRQSHFKGRYDDQKGRILTLLAQERERWFSCRQIHEVTGATLSSCRAQCGRLYRARLNDSRQLPYLTRRMIGHPWHGYFYQYRIQEGGINWVVNAVKNGMPISKYVEESEIWQKSDNDSNSLSPT